MANALEPQSVSDAIISASEKPESDSEFTKYPDGSYSGRTGTHIVEVRIFPKQVPDDKLNAKFKKDSRLLFYKYHPTETVTEIEFLYHPKDCDELLYGQECQLDEYVNMNGWDEFLEYSPREGRYFVSLHYGTKLVNNWSHYGLEYEQYLEWMPEDEPESGD